MRPAAVPAALGRAAGNRSAPPLLLVCSTERGSVCGGKEREERELFKRERFERRRGREPFNTRRRERRRWEKSKAVGKETLRRRKKKRKRKEI